MQENTPPKLGEDKAETDLSAIQEGAFAKPYELPVLYTPEPSDELRKKKEQILNSLR